MAWSPRAMKRIEPLALLTEAVWDAGADTVCACVALACAEAALDAADAVLAVEAAQGANADAVLAAEAELKFALAPPPQAASRPIAGTVTAPATTRRKNDRRSIAVLKRAAMVYPFTFCLRHNATPAP